MVELPTAVNQSHGYYHYDSCTNTFVHSSIRNDYNKNYDHLS